MQFGVMVFLTKTCCPIFYCQKNLPAGLVDVRNDCDCFALIYPEPVEKFILENPFLPVRHAGAQGTDPKIADRPLRVDNRHR
jgi:hypothetical protein